MPNQITGKILHIYPQETIPSRNGGKDIIKRAIVIDCTRFDPYTGERGYENTPMLEFIGEKCAELSNYQPGQVVTITFDVQGSRYRNKDGKESIFTRLQPYRIELRQLHRPPQQQPYAQPQQQYTQQPQQPYAPQPQQAYMPPRPASPEEPPLPFGNQPYNEPPF